jgi:hypothetical protein
MIYGDLRLSKFSEMQIGGSRMKVAVYSTHSRVDWLYRHITEMEQMMARL